MFMIATVREVWFHQLLVRDRATSQNFIVNTRNIRGFFPGDIIRIWYNGVVVPSFPPQIFAIRITRIFSPWCCR